MLALYNVIALGIIAFFLAGLIEGEVYAQNIFKSVEKLWIPKALEKEASQQLLNKLSKPKDKHRKEQIEQSAFLKTYNALRAEIEALEKATDSDSEKLLHQKKRLLKWQQEYFHAWMMGEVENEILATLKLEENGETLATQKKAFQEKMHSKKFRTSIMFYI